MQKSCTHNHKQDTEFPCPAKFHSAIPGVRSLPPQQRFWDPFALCPFGLAFPRLSNIYTQTTCNLLNLAFILLGIALHLCKKSSGRIH